MRRIGAFILCLSLSPLSGHPFQPRTALALEAEVVVPPEVLKVETVTSVGDESGKTLPMGARRARDDAVSVLLKLAQSGKPERLGFSKLPLPNSLTILDPLPQTIVAVEALKSYRSGRPINTLLRNVERLTFPVLVGGRVQSSFVLVKRAGSWKGISFGDGSIIRAIMRARISMSTGPMGSVLHAGKAARYRIVTVTGLNHTFVGAEGPNGLYLAPIFDDPRLGFGAGVPRRASDVFLELGPDARAHTGLPT
jgi:hypothetical protein